MICDHRPMIARDCNNIYLKKQPLIARFGKIVAPYTSTLNSTLWEYTTTIKALTDVLNKLEHDLTYIILNSHRRHLQKNHNYNQEFLYYRS